MDISSQESAAEKSAVEELAPERLVCPVDNCTSASKIGYINKKSLNRHIRRKHPEEAHAWIDDSMITNINQQRMETNSYLANLKKCFTGMYCTINM